MPSSPGTISLREVASGQLATNWLKSVTFGKITAQNGDPGAWLERCINLATQTRSLLIKPGEEFLFDNRQ